MELPDYWLPRPAFSRSVETEASFEHALSRMTATPGWQPDLELALPKWAYMCWLCERKGLLLHGSANPDIAEFEPRTPDAKDDDAFSQQTAVFASGDGIYPMIYALLDRARFRLRMLSGVLRFELPGGLSGPRYFFSITDEVLAQNPWREGTIYVLPPEGFVQQPPYRLGGWTVHDPHFACPHTVKPLAKIPVTPEDFPFLDKVRGHHDAELVRRFTARPEGFPWLS